jgi:hypothetical protein
MEMIKLPQMRLAQLQALTENTVTITKDLPEMAAQLAAVEQALENFQKGMIKSNASSNKNTLDRSRDFLNSGFFKGVESEQLFPQSDEAAKQALTTIAAVASKYDYALNRLSYDEQTARTDNMIAELEALDFSTIPQLGRWVSLMKEANTAFKGLVESYIEDKTEADNTAAASKAAIPLQDALNSLFTLLFAHVQISQTEPLITAYQELNTLIASYR